MATIAATLVVSVIIWLILHFLDPGVPVGGKETTVLVGFSLLLVVGARWIVRKARRSGP